MVMDTYSLQLPYSTRDNLNIGEVSYLSPSQTKFALCMVTHLVVQTPYLTDLATLP